MIGRLKEWHKGLSEAQRMALYALVAPVALFVAFTWISLCMIAIGGGIWFVFCGMFGQCG